MTPILAALARILARFRCPRLTRTQHIFLDMVRGKPSILFWLGWRVVWEKAKLLAIAEQVNAAVGLPPRIAWYWRMSDREEWKRE